MADPVVKILFGKIDGQTSCGYDLDPVVEDIDRRRDHPVPPGVKTGVDPSFSQTGFIKKTGLLPDDPRHINPCLVEREGEVESRLKGEQEAFVAEFIP